MLNTQIKTKQKTRSYIQCLLLGAASAAALMGTLAQAAEQDEETKKKKNAESIEVIEVTGFVGSLTRALNSKRFSNNVSDSISAEDVGKSTDQNIAEALQRVTGISISRDDGEGSTITARGVGGDLNNITLNGIPLTSSGDNQSVNLSEFSSDILSSIEVLKTPSASTDEGSLGATIRLNGFKPLNVKKDRRSIDIQARNNGFADSNDYKAQISLSQKLFDDRVGLSFVGSKETAGTRVDRVDITRWVPTDPINGATFVGDSAPTQQGDFDGDGNLDIRGLTPQNLRYMNQNVDRDRDTYQVALQLQLWEGSDIQFTYSNTKQDIDRDNQFLAINGDRSSVDANRTIIDPNTNTIITNIDTAFDRTTKLPFVTSDLLPNGNAYTRAAVWRNHREVTLDVQETEVMGLDIAQDIGEFSINLKAGRSETNQYDDFNLRSFWRPRLSNHPVYGKDQYTGNFAGYTCDNPSGDLDCKAVATDGYYDDGTNFEFQAFTNTGRLSDDTATNVYLDVVWDREIAFFTSFEAGLKYSKREKDKNTFFQGCNRGCVDGVLNALTLDDFTSESTTSDFGEKLGLARDHLTDGWAAIDIFAVRDFVEEQDAAGGLDTTFSPNNLSSVKLDTRAAYLQGNFEFMDGRLYGDVGIRYAETTVAATGTSYLRFDANQDYYSGGEGENLSLFGYEESLDGVPFSTNTATRDEAEKALLAVYGPLTDGVGGETARFPIIDEHEYDNWLPSLNVNYTLADDKILRFAVSETIARPEFNKLFPDFNVRENIFGPESTGRITGAKLNPYQSRNLDLSFEWYFDEASLFSVALFDKKFTQFSTQRSFNSYYRDVRADYFDLSQIDPNDNSSRANALPLEDVTAAAPTADNILLPFSGGDNQPGCMINRELELVETDNQNICDVVTLTESVNGTGGFVRGIEMSLQHNFTNLPGLWSGLGFVANYTYADSQTDEEILRNPAGDIVEFTPSAPLPGTSEHTYNTTMFWEKDGKLIRLAYNYRTDYLQSLTVNDGGSHWVEGYGTLDLSASWEVNKNFTLSFQGVNLTDTVIRRYDVRRPVLGEVLAGESLDLGSQPTGRTVRLENTGTIYRLGLRMTF